MEDLYLYLIRSQSGLSLKVCSVILSLLFKSGLAYVPTEFCKALSTPYKFIHGIQLTYDTLELVASQPMIFILLPSNEIHYFSSSTIIRLLASNDNSHFVLIFLNLFFIYLFIININS